MDTLMAEEPRSLQTAVLFFFFLSPLLPLTFLPPADIVIGCKGAKIAFPEVLRGVVAGVGGIPNAVYHSPQIAPYLLTGAPIPQHILETHLLTEVVEADKVLPTALRWAKEITAASPEAVWTTKEQINLHKAGLGVNDVVGASFDSELSQRLYRGDNIKEGLRSFVEVRRFSYFSSVLPDRVDPFLVDRNASRSGRTLRGLLGRSCRKGLAMEGEEGEDGNANLFSAHSRRSESKHASAAILFRAHSTNTAAGQPGATFHSRFLRVCRALLRPNRNQGRLRLAVLPSCSLGAFCRRLLASASTTSCYNHDERLSTPIRQAGFFR
jgi:hypothetical protein